MFSVKSCLKLIKICLRNSFMNKQTFELAERFGKNAIESFCLNEFQSSKEQLPIRLHENCKNIWNNDFTFLFPVRFLIQ